MSEKISSMVVLDNQAATVNFNDNKCDKYDYLIAVTCGAIGGIIDSFFVGMPGVSKLNKFTDGQVDKLVMNFAKKKGWKENGNIKSAIGFLERKYPVNYDQTSFKGTGIRDKIDSKTHHFRSLAHSPDVVGLFFSIINQFTNTSSFTSNGSIVTIDTTTFEVKGNNFYAKLACGFMNWFGHLMSDMAGSSGGKSRGSGIVMPFYELFGLCNFRIGSSKMTIAEIAQSAFNPGNDKQGNYKPNMDFRFGLAQAIPVVVTDILIRFIWAVRRKFQYKLPLKDCIPVNTHENLRMMLLVGNATLCVIDAIDAGIRTAAKGFDPVTFFMRLNLVAWFRLVVLVLKELKIRYGANIEEAVKKCLSTVGLCDAKAIALYNQRMVSLDETLEQILTEFKAELEIEYKIFISDIDKVFNTALYTVDQRLNNSREFALHNGVATDRIISSTDELDSWASHGIKKK